METTTSSASPGSPPDAAAPVVTSTPRATSGARKGLMSDGSCPLTRWPISASSVATALMPAPPTLVTWIVRGVPRSMSTVGASATGVLLGEPSDRIGRIGTGPGPGGHAHRAAGLVVGQEPVDLGDEALPLELGVGHQHGRARPHQ